MHERGPPGEGPHTASQIGSGCGGGHDNKSLGALCLEEGLGPPLKSPMSIRRENSHPRHSPRSFPTKRRYAAGLTVHSLALVAPQFESLSISFDGPVWCCSAPSLCERLRPWLAQAYAVGYRGGPGTGLSLAPLRLESIEVRLCAIAINPRRSLPLDHHAQVG